MRVLVNPGTWYAGEERSEVQEHGWTVKTVMTEQQQYVGGTRWFAHHYVCCCLLA